MRSIQLDVGAMTFQKRYEHIASKLRVWALKAQDVKAAFKYAGIYGVVRSINSDGIYGDDELELHVESLVIEQGRIDIQSIAAARGDGVLVLATELYDYGGHTKIILTWLELMKDVLRHKLVITRTLTAQTESELKKLGVKTVKIPSSGLSAVSAILDSAKGFNRIVMHTHPEDILSTVVARILAKAGYETIFYNHADHLFSFGLSAVHTVCEISSYGEEINLRTSRIKGAAVRLGIPLKKIDLSVLSLPVNMSFSKTNKIILSAGNSYKYKPGQAFLFADFIDELLSRKNNAIVVLVGPTGQEPWWVKRLADWGQRVLFLGALPHSEYMKLLKIADLYVDSYPITGGTAFPEALLAGKSCVGLMSPVQGYSLADELKVATPEALAQQSEMILNGDPETMRHIEKLRRRVISAQSEVAFKACILNLYMQKILTDRRDNKNSQMGLDSYYLEKSWRSSSIVNIPRKMVLKHLPFYRSFQILFLMTWNNFLTKMRCSGVLYKNIDELE